MDAGSHTETSYWSVDSNNTGTNFNYDSNGDRIQSMGNGSSPIPSNYTWSSIGQLLSMQQCNTTVSFIYDGEDRRPPLPPGARPFWVGVTLTRRENERDHTPSLFATPTARRATLLRAVDALNLRYGNGAIYWGVAHEARAAAPMRIAFNRIPDTALEQETTWRG
jgi:hypothetical protein